MLLRLACRHEVVGRRDRWEDRMHACVHARLRSHPWRPTALPAASEGPPPGDAAVGGPSRPCMHCMLELTNWRSIAVWSLLFKPNSANCGPAGCHALAFHPWLEQGRLAGEPGHHRKLTASLLLHALPPCGLATAGCRPRVIWTVQKQGSAATGGQPSNLAQLPAQHVAMHAKLCEAPSALACFLMGGCLCGSSSLPRVQASMRGPVPTAGHSWRTGMAWERRSVEGRALGCACRLPARRGFYAPKGHITAEP